MFTQVLMPALSPAMQGGRIAKWHVAEGQRVAAGDVIAEIATALATVEIEAVDEGRVEKILVPAGSSSVEANTPIAVIRADRDEAVPCARGGERDEGSRGAKAYETKARSEEFSARSGSTDPQVITYREALRDALAEEMRRDPDVVLLGVEVAQNRGAQKVAQGLLDEFGPRRVVTTPVLDNAVTGLAIGAAFAGLKPVVEFTSWAVALETSASISSAAAAHYLSGGELAVPIVFRGPNGWSPGAAGETSRCFGAFYARQPGLKVVAPASAADAKGLLKAAIRDPGPVIVLEHEMLYGVSEPVPASADWLVPIGSARIARAGRQVSVVAYARAVATALAAAEALAKNGIECEVIDLRTLRPLDIETVVASVHRTGHLVTVEDGWPLASIGSEVAAAVTERAFGLLAAPPERVAGADIPMPYAAELEALALPTTDSVVAAVRDVLGASGR
jgi:pyruvate dehydrogenase E1 component beta subunit